MRCQRCGQCGSLLRRGAHEQAAQLFEGNAGGALALQTGHACAW